ncbi:phosphohydrolase [Rhizobium grahamii]|uniref:Phosphohydrolase n=1 Tax=Rhizobium grahamii TaxID=1120045 RepID=A0A5Q0C6X2_9HYPH|nr:MULTISPECIES: metallophosphoesterase [Rhizobium]QFY59720.1 phosphohydrolase [Rhizobium grahamii]QRM51167.1 phosphohydrolase [Rhizobium sp. BG6]
MKAWIISDIHESRLARFFRDPPKAPKADICICAGDLTDFIEDSVAYIRRVIEPRMPVVLVLGNHDYFGHSISGALERARRLVEGSRIHLLENDTVTIGDCRFIGATLWTDFAVSIGDDEHIQPEERRVKALELVPSRILDFECIFRSDPRKIDENGMVTAWEILERHRESRKFIDRELSLDYLGRTVVVTHHAPLMQSFDPAFFGNVTNAAFASDLSDLIMRRRPSVWIHGHIHKFRDYMADHTRIICNPLGQRRELYTSGFRPGFTIDL